jgi:hypothetical protein
VSPKETRAKLTFITQVLCPGKNWMFLMAFTGQLGKLLAQQ